jgi:hypothetical protein
MKMHWQFASDSARTFCGFVINRGNRHSTTDLTKVDCAVCRRLAILHEHLPDPKLQDYRSEMK